MLSFASRARSAAAVAAPTPGAPPPELPAGFPPRMIGTDSPGGLSRGALPSIMEETGRKLPDASRGKHDRKCPGARTVLFRPVEPSRRPELPSENQIFPAVSAAT